MRQFTLIVLLSFLTAALSACGSGTNESSDTGGSEQTGGADGGPRVVASTSWVGAFASAAGASDVQLIAPADLQHPPDYDPRPSDLAAVADADFVLYTEFDGFAQRLREATGSEAELVPVALENSPAGVRAEVTRLGELFGTEEAAQEYLDGFDAEYARLSEEVQMSLPDPPPRVVSNVFFTPWVEFAGVELVGAYGPQPPDPSQIVELNGESPELVFENAHIPVGEPLVESGATEIELINFPGEDLDLLGVFRENARRIEGALPPSGGKAAAGRAG